MENISILFVDDEKEILDGYRRVFFKLRNELNLFFASSGEEALEIISNNRINLLVADIQMPGMDGIQLLYNVKNKYPNIIRILLSGINDIKKGIHASGASHQLLAKPINPADLIAIVNRAVKLHQDIQSESIIKIISGIGFIPVLPEIIYKIEKEFEKSEIDLKKVSSIISNDTALVAKVLQLVNSSYMGIKYKITNIDQAVSLLGTNAIKSLIIMIHLFNNTKLKTYQKKMLIKIANHSIKAAYYAKKIAISLNLDFGLFEIAFISGILHDLGKIVFVQNFPDYRKYFEKKYFSDFKMLEDEELAFGITHNETGAYLLALWGIPDDIVESVYYHHNPSQASAEIIELVLILHLANIFAKSTFPSKDIEIDSIDKVKYYFEDFDFQLWNHTFPDNKAENFINKILSDL